MQIQPTQWNAAVAAATSAAAGRDSSSTNSTSPGAAAQGVTDVNKSEQSQDRDANEQYSNHQRRQKEGSEPTPDDTRDGMEDAQSLLDLEANDDASPSQLDISG